MEFAAPKPEPGMPALTENKKEGQKESLLQFFAFAHLPEPLQDMSMHFADLATWIVTHLPRNAERTVVLRKLLEAKDCAVRAKLDEDALSGCMRTYGGKRDADGNAVVTIQEIDGRRRPLDPRLDLVNHSPTGLEWGYGGSGPAQLALALLADALGNDQLALGLHQNFKTKFIEVLDRNGEWQLTQAAVRLFVRVELGGRRDKSPGRSRRG